MQIAHAGRKGSANIPWIKKNSALNKNQTGWKTYSASSIRKDNGWPNPIELSQKKIEKVISFFNKKSAHHISTEVKEIETRYLGESLFLTTLNR